MGLADKLGLGKSATFIARVELQQLQQVPLVQAKFRIKWKFKGSTHTSLGKGDSSDDDSSVASHNRPHLASVLSGVRGSARPRRTSSPTPASNNNQDSTDEASSLTSKPSNDSGSAGGGAGARVYDSRTATPNPNKTPSLSTTSSFAPTLRSFAFPNSPSESPTSPNLTGESSSPFPSTHLPHESGPKRQDAHSRRPVLSPLRAEPKGATELLTLRDHTVNFNREIRCPVVIPLKLQPGGSKYMLQPLPLRLAVRQEVLGDGGRNEEVKTGEVLLDLSQFVRGPKSAVVGPKRFLLRQCSMNATLKIMVTMEWVDGEKDFIVPPLTSGQMKGSISTAQLNSTSGTSSMKSSTSHLPNGRPASSKSASINESAINRTDSSSSLSIESVPSKTSISLSASGRKGWQPPSSSVYPNYTSSLFGTTGAASTEGAVHIIEDLFTRRLERCNKPSDSEFLSFSLNRTPRLDDPTATTTAPVSTRGKEKERTGWFSKSTPSSVTNSISTHSLPPPIPSPSLNCEPPLGRKPSVASSMTKPRSVRWGDDEPPPPLGGAGGSSTRLSGAPNTRTPSSTSLSALGEVGMHGGGQARLGIGRPGVRPASVAGSVGGG